MTAQPVELPQQLRRFLDRVHADGRSVRATQTRRALEQRAKAAEVNVVELARREAVAAGFERIRDAGFERIRDAGFERIRDAAIERGQIASAAAEEAAQQHARFQAAVRRSHRQQPRDAVRQARRAAARERARVNREAELISLIMHAERTHDEATAAQLRGQLLAHAVEGFHFDDDD